MSVSNKHLLHQGPVLATLAGAAAQAFRQRMGHVPAHAPTTPTEEIVATVPPRPPDLVRDYVRHVGGDPSAYRGLVPPHLFPQWGFPLAARTLRDIPYPIVKALNGGCRMEMNAPLPAGEPLVVRARLESIDDNGRRAVLRQRVVTGTAAEPDALVAYLFAIVPTGGPADGEASGAESGNGKRQGNGTVTNGGAKKDRPRVPVDAEELARWRLGPDAGLDFAKLTGDFNPVHWIPALRPGVRVPKHDPARLRDHGPGHGGSASRAVRRLGPRAADLRRTVHPSPGVAAPRRVVRCGRPRVGGRRPRRSRLPRRPFHSSLGFELMSDFLLDNEAARKVIKTLGLPVPVPPKLRRARGPWEERPLHDDTVVVGATRDGALGPVLARTLTRAGASSMVTTDALMTAFAEPGEAFGRPAHRMSLEEIPDGTRPRGLVFDATGATDPADLRVPLRLLPSPGPQPRPVGPRGGAGPAAGKRRRSGRPRRPAPRSRASCAAWPRRSARRAPPRSVVYVDPGAEPRAPRPCCGSCCRRARRSSPASRSGSPLTPELPRRHRGPARSRARSRWSPARRGASARPPPSCWRRRAPTWCASTAPRTTRLCSQVARAIGGSVLLADVIGPRRRRPRSPRSSPSATVESTSWSTTPASPATRRSPR